MTKRFCDNEIWKKSWFLDLSVKHKLLTKFIFDNCDSAGIYEISWKLLEFYFDGKIAKEDFEKIKQIRFIDENTIFVEDFILFQQSIQSLDQLNPNNNAHKSIIKKLEKYNIFSAPSKPLLRGTSNSKGNSNSNSNSNSKGKKEEKKEKVIDIFLSPEIEQIFEIYQKNCPDLLKLSFEKRNRSMREQIEAFLYETDFNYEYFERVCLKANRLKSIANSKIDLKMLLNCHIGIMNGKYDDKEKSGKSNKIEEFLKRKRLEDEEGVQHNEQT